MFKILYVEDEAIFHMMLRDTLKDLPIEIQCCFSLEEVSKVFEEKISIDLIITDGTLKERHDGANWAATLGDCWGGNVVVYSSDDFSNRPAVKSFTKDRAGTQRLVEYVELLLSRYTTLAHE